MTVSQALAVLGLQGQVTKEEVRHAYLDLVKVWHPDRFAADPRLQAKAHAELKAINAAYEFLSAAWEHGPVIAPPNTSPDAPEPKRTSNPPSATAAPSAVDRNRPPPTWVIWAAAIGLTWAGAFFISTGGGSGLGSASHRPASLSSQRAEPVGSVAQPVDTAPVVPPVAERAKRAAPPLPDSQADPRARQATAESASRQAVATIAARDELLAQLDEVLRPDNGQELDLVLPDGGGQDTGRGTFNVHNGTKWDGVMVLIRLGVPRRAFYIRGGSQATLANVGANSYEAMFMLGTGWSREEFVADQQFLKFLKPVVFDEKPDVDKVTTSEISVTLHTVRGGNAKSMRVPPFRLAVRSE